MINDHDILEIFNNVFNAKYTNLDIDRNKVRQWDSMKHAELIIKLQKKFKVTFKAKDLGKIQNALDLKALLVPLVD